MEKFETVPQIPEQSVEVVKTTRHACRNESSSESWRGRAVVLEAVKEVIRFVHQERIQPCFTDPQMQQQMLMGLMRKNPGVIQMSLRRCRNKFHHPARAADHGSPTSATHRQGTAKHACRLMTKPVMNSGLSKHLGSWKHDDPTAHDIANVLKIEFDRRPGGESKHNQTSVRSHPRHEHQRIIARDADGRAASHIFSTEDQSAAGMVNADTVRVFAR